MTHIAFLLAAFSAVAFAQGGPPFRSDDPDTPGNRHWEINSVFSAERTLTEGSYATPNIDVNYGLGNRIQLKYEVPLAVHEFRDLPGHVAAGLGNSLLGVKWRFYAIHPRKPSGELDKSESVFGISTYPQLLLNNPTRSLGRDIIEPGPQFLLPLEINARLGPLRISGEVGYWFTNKDVPSSWIRGIIVGHEFGKRAEIDLEFYDQAATRAIGDEPKQRSSTIGIGGRLPVTKNQWIWFMGMVGRSLVTVTAANGQPSWIASVGFQFLSAQRRRHSSEE